MIRLSFVLMAALALLISSGGCEERNSEPGSEPGTEQSAGPDQGSDKVSQAVIIGKEIQANPDAAQAILERHGMSQEQFEALMFEIAEDEEMSRAYTSAMGS